MQLQVFEHKNLGNVRVIGDNENPLFCLSDVCKILELESIVANAIKAELKRVLKNHLPNRQVVVSKGGELDSAPLQSGVQQGTLINQLRDSKKPNLWAF